MIFASIAIACIAFAAGSLIGHAAGYYRRGEVERRRLISAIVGGPKYARRETVYDVKAPNGLWFHGPDLASAQAFADKYGGAIVASTYPR